MLPGFMQAGQQIKQLKLNLKLARQNIHDQLFAASHKNNELYCHS